VEKEIYKRLYKMLSDSKQFLIEKNVAHRTNHITVAVEHFGQSHNPSAVVRTCDCFGVQNVYIIARKKYKVNRDVAMGAGKWITEHRYAQVDTMHCLQEIKEKGYKIIATSPHAEKSIFDLDISQPVCLLFGTEKHGLSETVFEAADETVSIPMYGFTESFNISVSVALCLQALRQKMEQEVSNWKLSEDEQVALKLEWCRNILRNGEAVYDVVKKQVETETKVL